ncbi:Uncharacterised protein [Klebsiella pneumoniae]|uniref:Uncharacterized protein n=1 Tax=Klebsiella pneumoniae TaxID=573 RepID=A0A378AQC3_KLEPN|nr:Uncharacterised protein [Klebsiella pneumoniae]
MNLPAREVYRERQIRQLEEDAQWVAERLERRMNIPAPQREATWPLAAMRAALQTLARERHYQLLLVNGDGHLLAASHALPASVLAQVQAQFPREMQPPLFGSHYQTIQPFAPHQRMLSRALNGNAGLAGWNLVMLAPDGGLPLVAGGLPLAGNDRPWRGARQRAAGAEAGGARQAKTLIANRAVRDGESAGWRAGSAEAAPGPDRRSAG